MNRSLYTALFMSFIAIGCGPGASVSDVDGAAGAAGSEETEFTAPDGAVCADATPCGNCDQDCRLQGNPFAGNGGAGGDAPGSSQAGGGGTGYDGEVCSLDTDCRGMCGEAGACAGFGSGGFNGDSCKTSNDCRGVCDRGMCTGSGADPSLGGGGSSGSGGSSGTDGLGGTGDGSGTGDPGTDPNDPNGGDGTGGGGAGGTDQNTCLDLEIQLQHAIPTLVLLIDQSGSMREGFGGGMNRWEAAYSSLMDPTNGLINDIQGAFRIGMSLYSNIFGQGQCPLLADVRPDINNYDAIERVFAQAQPLEETPTGESILGTLRQFDVHQDQGRKIMLLATDGEPDTCQDPRQIGQPEAIAATQEAFNRGISTVILSVGDNVGASHLEDMANAGMGMPVDGPNQAPYYSAQDPQQLKAEMQAIVDSARSCIFRVQGGVIDPGIVDHSTVTLDGMALQFGGADGWMYHQNRQTCQGAKQCIELRGTACDMVQDGLPHTISGDFLCTYYDPENPPIGGGGGAGGDGGNGTGTGDGGGGTTLPGPGQCSAPMAACEYDSDCCSGVCSAQTNGICVTN